MTERKNRSKEMKRERECQKGKEKEKQGNDIKEKGKRNKGMT